MMIFGLLSLFQVAFLPGFLFLRVSHLKFTVIQIIIFSFALSLILNYVGVFFLVGLSWYIRPVVIGIFCVEVLLLIYFNRHSLWSSMTARVGTHAARASYAIKENLILFVKSPFLASRDADKLGGASKYFTWFMSAINLLFLCAALGALGWACMVAIHNVGTVFMEWDPLVSWNRWAVDWSHNRFPLNTFMYYPQLIPANWSICYVFMDYPLQFFPKAIMPLFLFFILALMFDLAFLNRSVAYLVGLVATAFLFRAAMGAAIAEGYADMAVAFMGFLSICCLIYADRSEEGARARKYVLLGGVFAAGALVTKQSGIYVLVCYVVLTAALFFKFRGALKRRDFLTVILSTAASIAIIDAPFFLWRAYEISKGIDPPASLNFYEAWNSAKLGVSYTERLSTGYAKMIGLFDAPLLAKKAFLQSSAMGLCLVGFILAFADRKRGRIAAVLGLGWWVLWALFLSYDLRNLTIAFPFMGLAIGIGWTKISDLGKMRGAVLLGIAVFALVAFTHSVSGGILKEKQIALQKKIGHPQINELLLNYNKTSGIDKKILSHYQMLNYVPGFYGSIHIQHFESPAINPANQLAAFRENINRPEVGFVLFPIWADGPVLDEVNFRIASNGFQEIFREHGFIFAKINRDSEGRIFQAASLHLEFISWNLNLKGLRALEGPYPQWNLPPVRWAVNTSLRIDFRCDRLSARDRMQLKMSFTPWIRTSADMVVKLNGREIMTYRANDSKTWKDEILSLHPRERENHLEITFPGPPPPERLFMLFREFSLNGNFSI